MTKTLLIVEDDPELQELYLTMLEDQDYRIMCAVDGGEALEKVRREPPDLILLDIILDEMMGDELFLKLKQEPRTAGTPVVLVTVLPAERCRRLLEIDPGTRFLRKPFRRSQLLEVVRQGLTQYSRTHSGE
jgi:CheY-like chemotaxis protein